MSEKPQSDQRPQRPEKKRYEKPRILTREPLEAVAAICTGGTSKSNVVECKFGPISS